MLCGFGVSPIVATNVVNYFMFMANAISLLLILLLCLGVYSCGILVVHSSRLCFKCYESFGMT